MPLDFRSLPFQPCRIFTVSGAPAGTHRGGHGHHAGEQLLICLEGRIDLWMRRQNEEARASLAPAGPGLVLGAGVWCRQTYVSAGSVLLVLASTPYDPASYFTEWSGA